MSEYTHIPSSDYEISSQKDDQTESGNFLENGHSHKTDQRRIWPYVKREPFLYAVVSAFIFLFVLNIVLATSLYLKTRNVGDRYGKSHCTFPVLDTKVLPLYLTDLSGLHREKLFYNRKRLCAASLCIL